tara:strand:+ start:317 stop:478 length:162 start_codon:yes stop_codon:yes gene_type:complete
MWELTNDFARGAMFGFAILGGAAFANVSFSWITGKTITGVVADFGIGDDKGVL